MEFGNLLLPFFIAHIHLQHIKMQIAIAGMGQAHAFKVIVFRNLHQMVQANCNFIHGHN